MIDAIRAILRNEIARISDVPYVLEVQSMPVLDMLTGLGRGDRQPQECRDLISGETFQYTFRAPLSKKTFVSAVSRNGRLYELYTYEPLPRTGYLDRNAEREAERQRQARLEK